MYTFYEYPKCSTCRKAKAELNQLGLDVESINIKENPPSAQFLKELLEGSDLELKKFFNTSGQSYRSLGLKDKLPTLSLDEAVELLASDGMLIKRPILIKDGKVLDIIDLVKKCNESIILNENPFLTFYENSRFLFEENDKTYHQMFLDILITITNDRIYKILGQDDKIIFSSELEKINDKVELDYKKTFEQLEKILEFKTRLKYNISLETMYMQMFIEIMR